MSKRRPKGALEIGTDGSGKVVVNFIPVDGDSWHVLLTPDEAVSTATVIVQMAGRAANEQRRN